MTIVRQAYFLNRLAYRDRVYSRAIRGFQGVDLNRIT